MPPYIQSLRFVGAGLDEIVFQILAFCGASLNEIFAVYELCW
jgi:hypothetical protein